VQSLVTLNSRTIPPHEFFNRMQPELGVTVRAERMPDKTLAEDVRWFVGSVFGELFVRLAFDQVAYREIAAAVHHTGRFAENFVDRGLRSVAHLELMLFGDAVDARTEIEKLKRLHRAVHGTGVGSFADTRYSALRPQAWKWVAVSGLNTYYQAYVHTVGRSLNARQREVVYRVLRTTIEPLELPSRATILPGTLAEMTDYYNDVAQIKLADNEFLRFACDSLTSTPLPTLLVPPALRPLATPLWRVLVPLLTRPVVICSTGAAHPKMRQLLHFTWMGRHQLEFAAYTRTAAFAWRHLPRRITMKPMAYNRYRYEKLRERYHDIQLTSFIPNTPSPS
jgi:uncharacterized protein (DUF2236 family)